MLIALWLVGKCCPFERRVTRALIVQFMSIKLHLLIHVIPGQNQSSVLHAYGCRKRKKIWNGPWDETAKTESSCQRRCYTTNSSLSKYTFSTKKGVLPFICIDHVSNGIFSIEHITIYMHY